MIHIMMIQILDSANKLLIAGIFLPIKHWLISENLDLNNTNCNYGIFIVKFSFKCTFQVETLYIKFY